MRRVLALALVLVALPCLSADPIQLPLNSAGKVTYQEAVSVDGVAVPELYARAKAWAKAKCTPQAQLMTDMIDGQTSAEISFRDAFTALPGNKATQVTVHYILTLEVREARFRYTLTWFTVAGPKDQKEMPLEASLDGAVPKPGSEALVGDIHARVYALTSDLKAAMARPSPPVGQLPAK